jgi:hypothetical protein
MFVERSTFILYKFQVNSVVYASDLKAKNKLLVKIYSFSSLSSSAGIRSRESQPVFKFLLLITHWATIRAALRSAACNVNNA